MSPEDLNNALQELEEDIKRRLEIGDDPISTRHYAEILQLLKYRKAIVRDYTLREARRIVWKQRAQTFKDWSGVFIAFGAIVTAFIATKDWLVELIKWAASKL